MVGDAAKHELTHALGDSCMVMLSPQIPVEKLDAGIVLDIASSESTQSTCTLQRKFFDSLEQYDLAVAGGCLSPMFLGMSRAEFERFLRGGLLAAEFPTYFETGSPAHISRGDVRAFKGCLEGLRERDYYHLAKTWYVTWRMLRMGYLEEAFPKLHKVRSCVTTPREMLYKGLDLHKAALKIPQSIERLLPNAAEKQINAFLEVH